MSFKTQPQQGRVNSHYFSVFAENISTITAETEPRALIHFQHPSVFHFGHLLGHLFGWPPSLHVKKKLVLMGQGQWGHQKGPGCSSPVQKGAVPPGAAGLISGVMALSGYMQVLGGEPCSGEELLSGSSRMRV